MVGQDDDFSKIVMNLSSSGNWMHGHRLICRASPLSSWHTQNVYLRTDEGWKFCQIALQFSCSGFLSHQQCKRVGWCFLIALSTLGVFFF